MWWSWSWWCRARWWDWSWCRAVELLRQPTTPRQGDDEVVVVMVVVVVVMVVVVVVLVVERATVFRGKRWAGRISTSWWLLLSPRKECKLRCGGCRKIGCGSAPNRCCVVASLLCTRLRRRRPRQLRRAARPPPLDQPPETTLYE